MDTNDWVETPQGIGVLGHISYDGLNAFVWIDKILHAFLLMQVKPVPKEISDILRSV